MLNNKCRVCLADEANHPIFENIESEESIHFKFTQCFKEEVEDVEGYPRNICESCNDILNTTINFITKYYTSCKLLSNVAVVKKEASSDNSDDEVIKDEIEIEIIKNEPATEAVCGDPLDNSIDFELANIKHETKPKENRLAELKEKLKKLKEINFKRKSVPKNNKRTTNLETKLDGGQESLKSNLPNKLKNEKPQKATRKKSKKPVLPKPPKEQQNETHPCDFCGKSFGNKHTLRHHLKASHFNTPRECPECQKVLNSDYYLQKHMKRIHGDKTLVCDTCGKGFAFIGELNTHVKTAHLKQRRKLTKKYTCDQCAKNFFNSKALIIHIRSAHTGERPAICTVCDSRFYHEEYLKQHMRLHTGETPYKCPICSRGYAQSGNLKSHISNNHRLADLSPELLQNMNPNWLKYLKKP